MTMTTPTDTETTNDCIKSETLVEMSNNASNDKKANEKDDAGVIVTYNSSTTNNDHNFFEETCYNLANLLPNLEDTAQVAACGTIAGALMMDLCAAEIKADKRVQRALLGHSTSHSYSQQEQDLNENENLSGASSGCVLCHEQNDDFCVFPCCTDRPLVCIKCMNILSFDVPHHIHGKDDSLPVPHDEAGHKIAHCPLCQRWISIHAPQHITQLTRNKGTCVICNQYKSTLVIEHDEGEEIVMHNIKSLPSIDDKEYPDDEAEILVNEINQSIMNDSENIRSSSKKGVCDACFLGKVVPLSYECSDCGGIQRIPHPMYRYQATLGSFSSNTWKCHLKCTGFTKWRISAEDMFLIPPGDQPTSWKVNYLQSARDKIVTENSKTKIFDSDNINKASNGGLVDEIGTKTSISDEDAKDSEIGVSTVGSDEQQQCVVQ